MVNLLPLSVPIFCQVERLKLTPLQRDRNVFRVHCFVFHTLSRFSHVPDGTWRLGAWLWLLWPFLIISIHHSGKRAISSMVKWHRATFIVRNLTPSVAMCVALHLAELTCILFKHWLCLHKLCSMELSTLQAWSVNNCYNLSSNNLFFSMAGHTRCRLLWSYNYRQPHAGGAHIVTPIYSNGAQWSR